MGSKTKQELIQQCLKLNLSTEGTVEDLKKRIKEHSTGITAEINFQPSLKQAAFTGEHTVIKNFFVQLDVSNLIYYLNYALILPVSLIENDIYRTTNRKHDLLSDFPEYIILSNKPVSPLKSEEVMVEINIEGLPVEPVPNYDIFYCNEPIPISRIINLIFPSDTSRAKFLTDVRIYPDSFFPESLCVVSAKQNSLSVLPSFVLPPNTYIPKLRDSIKSFDRILGMFCFMRNAGVMYAEKDNVFQEYTSIFFYALNLIYDTKMRTSERDAPVFKYMLSPGEVEGKAFNRLFFAKIVELIYNNQDFNYTLAKKMLSETLTAGVTTREEEIDINLALNIFERLETQQAIFKEAIGLDVFRRHYAILGLLFLAHFSNKAKSHSDKQAVRILLSSTSLSIPRNLAEYLLGLLGLYYGYGNLVKADQNLKIEDQFFAGLLFPPYPIKVKELNFIERTLIEACFEFSKSGKRAVNGFSMARYKNTSFEKRNIVLLNTDVYSYYDRCTVLLDTKVTIFERHDKVAGLVDEVIKKYPTIITSKSMLLQYIIENQGLPKNTLVAILTQSLKNLQFETIRKLIDLDFDQQNIR